jgi:hypothetical protein
MASPLSFSHWGPGSACTNCPARIRSFESWNTRRGCRQGFRRARSASCVRRAAFCAAKAQSSHGVSASTSDASTVAPHQMRRPGRRIAVGGDVVGDTFFVEQPTNPWRTPLAHRAQRKRPPDRRSRQTEVLERVRRIDARKSTTASAATQSARSLALASARAISPEAAGDFAHAARRASPRPPAWTAC